jgi:hypothetical protein
MYSFIGTLFGFIALLLVAKPFHPLPCGSLPWITFCWPCSASLQSVR